MSTREALKQFAKAVGLKLRFEAQEDGSKDLVLYDANGEPLVTEYNAYDMAESIGGYAGGHPEYLDARAAFELETE